MRSQEAKWDRLDLFLAFHRQCEPKKYLKICSFKFDEIWQKSYSYRAYVNKSLKKKKVSPSSYFIENFKKTFATICILKTEGHLLQDVCKTAKSSMLL